MRVVRRTLTGAGRAQTGVTHVMEVGGHLRQSTRDCVLTQHSGRIKHVRRSIMVNLVGSKLLWVRGVLEEPSSASTPGTCQETMYMRWLKEIYF